MVTSNNEHIRADLRHVLGLNDRDRLAFMDRPTLLRYPAGDNVLAELKRLLEMPKRPRMGNLLMVGETNNGKTTLVRKFHELHGTPSIDEKNGAVKPVIIVEAPPTADEKSLHLSILERFHAPYRTTAPVTQLRYQALHLLRECRTRMLIIDEFHSLLTGPARKQAEVMNTIKFLCNELQIPIVSVGTQVAVNVLRTDPQHASRFRVVKLPRWTLNRDFQRLLKGFEETLPLKRESKLAERKTATLLHDACKGNLGNLREGLVTCAREAIEKGSERITPELIGKRKPSFRPTEAIPERQPAHASGPSR